MPSSATSIQYWSALKSVTMRIFGIPILLLISFMALNFSSMGFTLPGLQNMISRMRYVGASEGFDEGRAVERNLRGAGFRVHKSIAHVCRAR